MVIHNHTPCSRARAVTQFSCDRKFPTSLETSRFTSSKKREMGKNKLLMVRARAAMTAAALDLRKLMILMTHTTQFEYDDRGEEAMCNGHDAMTYPTIHLSI